MKRSLATAAVLVAAAALLGADLADARRLGGGMNLGAQRRVAPAPKPAPNAPSAAPSAPNAPAQAAAPKAAPAAAAGATAGASRWLGPIAGLAAGLGLAALLSHLGLSEQFASLLLLALLIGGGVLLVRLFLARGRASGPMQYAGVPAARVEPRVDGTRAAFEPVLPAGPGPTAPAAAADSRFPPGFDPEPFVEQAKLQFRKLQSAYDAGDRQALAEVMTPGMLAEVERDLHERHGHLPTEVVRLDAEVLDVATENRQYWMSVRFTGLVREDGTVLPKDLDEVWNLTKPVDGSSGWLLAGIQQTHAMA